MKTKTSEAFDFSINFNFASTSVEANSNILLCQLVDLMYTFPLSKEIICYLLSNSYRPIVKPSKIKKKKIINKGNIKTSIPGMI